MNFTKAKMYLEKINLLYQGIQEDNQVSPIERKLMLDYISKLYDSFLFDGQQNNSIPAPPPAPVRETPVSKPAPVKVATPPPPPPTPAPEVVEAPIVQQPAYVPPPAPVVEAPVKEEAKPKKFDLKLPTAKVTPSVAPTSFKAVYNELFEQEGTRDLSQKLSERPISSLKSAWGVGDKFLIVNELFGKDISAFDDAIGSLNDMSSLNEARGYLESNIIEKYNWTDVSKLKVAKDFIKTVKRRYV